MKVDALRGASYCDNLSRRHFLAGASAIALVAQFPLTSDALCGVADLFPVGPTIVAEVPEGERADDVALVSQHSVGRQRSDLFSGFSSPPSIVTLRSGTKFLTRTDNEDRLLLRSKHSCLDSEISTWLRKGIVFLRLIGGRAIFFSVNVSAPQDLRVGIVVGLDEDGLIESSGTRHNTHVIALSRVAGWSPTYTPGDLYTFGCNGFDVYVKYRGVEILRYREWRHVDPGHAAIWQQGQGISDTVVHYAPARLIGSNRASRYFDIRDFGAKTARTTGVIGAGSTSLTVASPLDFAVGDHIVVEIGGESGAGRRGTNGVGGAWPSLSYPDAATMNADTGKPERTYAWDRSTGDVYIYTSNAWIHREDGGGPYNQAYYSAKSLPRALRAKIVEISDKVVTLDSAALESSTNASVYVDCAKSFGVLTDSLEDDLAATPNITLGIPEGSFALGSAIAGSARPGLTISGRGKGTSVLFSPKGTTCVSLVIDRSIRPMVRDFTMIGNHGPGRHPDGFQLVYQAGSNDFYSAWPTTCGMTACTGGTFTDIGVANVLSYAISQANCTDCWAYNCHLKMDASLKQYTQWFFEAANAVGGGFVDCSATGPSLMKCFETFSSDSVQFVRCGGQNVLASANSSGGYIFERFYSTITADSYDNVGAGFFHEPVININANAYPTAALLSKGGVINCARIIQAGFAESTNRETIPAIQIQAPCPNVTVSGEYPGGLAPFSEKLGGYFQSPDYAVLNPGKRFATVGAVAVRSDASNTTIRGIRSVGSTKRGRAGIELGVSASNSRVIDCVTDTLMAPRDTARANVQTNAGVKF